MNVLFVSHCDFSGNSAMHVFSIANQLTLLGMSCVVCVPQRPETLDDLGEAKFRVLSYEAARTQGVVFPDSKAADIIHAWTPRELVRKLTEELSSSHHCPYLVHLEDNEENILENELPERSYQEIAKLPVPALDRMVPEHRSHPIRYKQLIARAAGVTVLMDRLLEFVPSGLPHLIFYPGFDERFATGVHDRETFRTRHNIQPEDKVIAYTGNIHQSNVREVGSLILAVGLLHKRGWPIKLLKTGWNYARPFDGEGLDTEDWLVDLNFLPRAQIPELLSAADLLVQPGKSGRFNDYRFPSKLPEFLASGKPVILPATNIGRFLHDGKNCILLHAGHALEIATKIEYLLRNPEVGKSLGAAGRQFALDNLSWRKNVPPIADFYRHLLDKAKPRETAVFPTIDTETPQPNDAGSSPTLPVKPIAFYLPQFHPIKENDEWWGKGFTEWTNVSRATPNFVGHDQPRLPADLGFYDLRVPEVMEQQAQLARRYGIYGFCFYYYWFNGRRLLERPLAHLLTSGKPDIPFCICWANENWSRRWDGSDHEILVQQEYSDESDERFIRDVIPFLRDSRYIRVEDAPVLLVYRVDQLPDARRTAMIWRRACRAEGIGDLHLVAVQSFGIDDPRPYGFDAAVEFPPHTQRALVDPRAVAGVHEGFEGYLEDYLQIVDNEVRKPLTDYVRYRGVMPGWDNTPRRQKRAHVLIRSSPEAYKRWLTFIARQTLRLSSVQEPLIFINAWNEWAEGAYLEPDQRNGSAYLQATQDALLDALVEDYGADGDSSGPAASPVSPPSQPDSALGEQLRLDAAGRTEATSRQSDIWFNDAALARIYRRYHRTFPVAPLSYATVRDFCDSYDFLQPIATANGDLKDCQRPWVFKALLSRVPKGARVLEIGAGEPLVSDLLARLGYEVWVVDPYDGSGNGPQEYERFRRDYPNLRFVRDLFSDKLLDPRPRSFDCIYSISVLEHIPDDGLMGVFRGLTKFLKADGVSIHAIDHVHRGNEADEHLDKLRLMIKHFGLSQAGLERMLNELTTDSETYYLSAESHNRWRAGVPYDQFPMRICVSIQTFGTAAMMGRFAP